MTEGQGRHKPKGMVRETFRHAAIYSGAGVLGRMISFFMLPFYAHILRDIGYGVIGMIDTSLSLLGSLFAYSFQTAVMRIYHEEPDPARKPVVATTGTAVVAGVVGPLALLAAACSRPLSSLLLDTPDYWVLICLAVAAFSMDMVAQTAQTILIIQRRSGVYSLIGLMRLIVGMGLNILLVVVLRWDLMGFFISQLAVALVSLVVSLVLLFRLCGTGFDREIAKRLSAFQTPLIPGAIASFFGRQAERVIVRFQLDLSSVGVLEMGYKFPMLLSILVIGPFMKSWSTQRLEIADEPSAPERIGQVFSYFYYLSLLGGLLLSVNILTVLQLLTPPEFWAAYSIARIQTLQVIVHGIGMHVTFGLVYSKRTDVMARLAMLTAAVKLGTAYTLISAWGLYGAAWSSLASTAIYTVWGGILSQRRYRIIMEWRKLGLMTAFALALYWGIDRLSTASIAAWGAPVLDFVQGGLDGMRDSALGRWKDGKLLAIMSDRGDLVLDLGVRTLLVGIFLAIMPAVHVETQRKLQRKWARFRARS